MPAMGLDDRVTAALDWTVVMPVKSLAAAKSRLAHPSPHALSLAFLLDALDAVLATPDVAEVIVVTGDPEVTAAASEAGCRIVDDRGHPGINAAAAWGASHATDGGVAVMVSDLPCLTPAACATALRLAAQHATSFLPDADGQGTTMWFATPGHEVGTAFGVGSRAAHAGAGAVDLVVHHPGDAEALLPARRDVDTLADLTDARRVGVGPHCRALLD